MLDLRAYRIGFAPALAALVVLAFSLDGVPEPLQPVTGTIEFDAQRAAAQSRALVRVAPERAPGSDGAAAAADLVHRELEAVASGTLSEQRFTASVDGEDVELRNVILTLPGDSNGAIVVLAGRASGAGSGATSSAAATGMLLELASALGVSGRERSVVIASIDGAAAEAEGVREMIDALPDETAVEAVVVISQPGSATLSQPHLVTSSGSRERPSLELIRTGEEALATRAGVGAGLDGALGQIFRLALPAAAGPQAALLDDGVDSIGISSAGEVPLPPGQAEAEDPDPESLERFGAAALGLVGALDASPGPFGEGTSSYIRLGSNSLPGWTVAMLGLVLLLPPLLPVSLALARAGREGTGRGGALGWVLEWTLVALAPLLALLGMALVGLIPAPEVPYDPGRFEIGPLEVAALLVLVATGAGAWWALGLRRGMGALPPHTAAAAAGAVCLAACAAAWLANPFLALLMAPLPHVVMAHATPRRAALVGPLAIVAVVPLATALIHVAGSLDWGATVPWQLVVLVAGGGLGVVSAASLAVALVAFGAIVATSLRSHPQATSRGRP